MTPEQQKAALALVNALTPDQHKQAILGYEVRNIVLGPGSDGKTIAPEGIRASALSSAQREMLVDLTREWVGILGDEAAALKLKEIQAGRRRLYFRNDHQPMGSVYLVNALVPPDDGVTVVRQVRDPLQRAVRVDCDVQPQRFTQLLWLLLGVAAPGTLVLSRRIPKISLGLPAR